MVTKSSVSASIQGNNLEINVRISDLSNLCGTHPKIQLTLYSKMNGVNQLSTNNYIGKFGRDTKIDLNKVYKILKYRTNLMISTNKEFADLILYPKDTLRFNTGITLTPENKDILKTSNLVFIELEFLAKETIRTSEIFLIEVNENSSKIVKSSTKEDSISVFTEYHLNSTDA